VEAYGVLVLVVAVVAVNPVVVIVCVIVVAVIVPTVLVLACSMVSVVELVQKPHVVSQYAGLMHVGQKTKVH